MGAKQTGCRKYLFLYIACSAAFIMTGSACRPFCGNWSDEEVAVTGHDTSAIDSVSQTTPDTMASLPAAPESRSEHLETAYTALAAGNHTTASRELARVSCSDKPLIRSEAVFLTALLYADPGNPAGNMARARETLQRVAKEHPDSERAGEVRILADLLDRMQSIQAENLHLHEEINGLKKKLAAEQSSVQRLKSLMKKMKEIDLGLMPEKQ